MTNFSLFTFIRCRIGGRDYALETTWILDIKKANRLRVDLQKNGYVGSIEALGQTIQVFDLARRFKHKRPKFNPEHDRIILINASPTFGIVVEGVSQAIQLPSNRVYGLAPIVYGREEKSYFDGVALTADTMLLLLSPTKLFPQFTAETPDYHQELTPPTYDKVNEDWLSQINIGPTPTLVQFALPNTEEAERPLNFGFSASQVLEIMPPASILPIHGTPPYVLGFTRWHEMAIPLLDIGRLLGRSQKLILNKEKEYCFILIRDSQGNLACVCAQGEVDIKATPILSRPSKQELPYDHPAIMGLFELPRETLAILNTIDLLGA